MSRYWRIKDWIVKAKCSKCTYTTTQTHTCRAEELAHWTWAIDYCPHCKGYTCTHTIHEQKQAHTSGDTKRPPG